MRIDRDTVNFLPTCMHGGSVVVTFYFLCGLLTLWLSCAVTAAEADVTTIPIAMIVSPPRRYGQGCRSAAPAMVQVKRRLQNASALVQQRPENIQYQVRTDTHPIQLRQHKLLVPNDRTRDVLMQLYKAPRRFVWHPPRVSHGARFCFCDAPAAGDVPAFVRLPPPSRVWVLRRRFLPVREEAPGRQENVLQRRDGRRERRGGPLPVEGRLTERVRILSPRPRGLFVDVDVRTDDDTEVRELVQRLERGYERGLCKYKTAHNARGFELLRALLRDSRHSKTTYQNGFPPELALARRLLQSVLVFVQQTEREVRERPRELGRK